MMEMTLREMQERRLVADEFEAANTDFALTHFTQLSKAEGYRRAPWWRDAMHGKIGVMYDGRMVEPVFYECDQYNVESRECMAYETRPPSCRSFPWPRGVKPVKALLPEACEFRRDIGEVPVPIDVMLARKRGGERIA